MGSEGLIDDHFCHCAGHSGVASYAAHVLFPLSLHRKRSQVSGQSTYYNGRENSDFEN